MLDSFIGLFRKPTPEIIVSRALVDEQRNLLIAQEKRDFYQQMCAYHEQRIKCLVKASNKE